MLFKMAPSAILYLFSRVHATLHPALSVRRSVGRSVGWSHFTFFYVFYSLTSLLLPKWSSDLKYGPCPPTRDWGSRVSGLVQSSEDRIDFFNFFRHNALRLCIIYSTHQISGTAWFKLGELPLFLRFLVVQSMHNPWQKTAKSFQ